MIQSLQDVRAAISNLRCAQGGTREDPLVRSAERTLREGRGRCIEGAMAAAYLMEELGSQPIVLQLLAKNPDDDHAVYLYHDGGLRTIGHSALGALQSLQTPREDVLGVVHEYARSAKESGIFVNGWGLVDLTELAGWRDSEHNLAVSYLEHSQEFAFERYD